MMVREGNVGESSPGAPVITSRRRFLESAAASSALFAGLPLATLATVVPSTPARTALVIGNERYRHNPLRNAVNDARAMAELLKQAGFAVDLQLNAGREQMVRSIDALGQSVANPNVGFVLFYYAGHAAQLDWRNYLLPVDGEVDSATNVRKQCVDLSVLLGRLAKARSKTALIILDACRDDPFGPRFRPPHRGLSQYDAPPGSLLAFATAPGRVAIELSNSRHGLYTEHLVRELSVKGVRIEDALKRVRLNVRIASRGAQVPWESTSLESDIYLFPAPRLSEAELERQLREELALWSKIKASNQPDDWARYLRRFPNGRFAELAQVRLSRLLAAREAAQQSAATQAASGLQLGPGLPVPVRMQGSGNPNSAGTYLFRPVWTVGDEYVFQDLDLYSGVVQRTTTIAVTRVDTARDRVEFSNGSVADLTGSQIRAEGRVFETPLLLNPTELQVGKKWVSRFQQTGVVHGFGEYDFRVLGREKVKVPAGEFSAFKIDGTGWFNRRGEAMVRGIRNTRWVVPGINIAVRRERFQFGDARVLVSAKQRVSA